MEKESLQSQLHMRTLRAAMTDMALQTVGQIRDNFYTQGIFPFGEAWHGRTRSWTTADGWYEENRRRKQKYLKNPNVWHSTGGGAESFHWQVRGDLDNGETPPKNLSFDFFYAEHLRYAEMGVGLGRPWSKVSHARNAEYKSRYDEWRPKPGNTNRPSIMMEFRHLQGRLERYLRKRYEIYYEAYVLRGLEGVTGERDFGLKGGKMRWYVKSDLLPDLPFGPK